MPSPDLVFPAKAGIEGKSFCSIDPIDMAAAFEKVGVEVNRSEIRMPGGPNVEVTVKVVAEE